MARVYNPLWACELWYPLGDNGFNINDISGHPSRSLQPAVGTFLTTGPGGGSLLPGHSNLATSFNGTTQAANETATELITDISTILTICFWYKTSVPNQTNSYIFTYRNVSAGKDNFAIIYGFVANKFELYSDNLGNSSGATQRGPSDITLTDSLWHHWAVTTDGSFVRWYRDGLPATPTAMSWSYGSGVDVSSRTISLMATFTGAVFADFNQGILKDFRLYSRTLTPGEIFNISREPFNLVFPIDVKKLGPTPPTTVAFRRTRSALGTRIGSRQMAM